MKRWKKAQLEKILLLSFLLCILLSSPALGQDEKKAVGDFLDSKKIDLQFVSGPLFSTHIFCNGDPTTNAWQSNIRLGWILYDPSEKRSWYRGNVELLLQGSYAIIYRGPGSYWGGISALIRYNFVQPGSKWIPYIQGGAGIVYNDVYRDKSQNSIGESIEFTPQASVGLRYFLNKNWSFDVEGAYHHISNANIANRNDGLNSVGGFIGLSYVFDQSP